MRTRPAAPAPRGGRRGAAAAVTAVLLGSSLLVLGGCGAESDAPTPTSRTATSTPPSSTIPSPAPGPGRTPDETSEGGRRPLDDLLVPAAGRFVSADLAVRPVPAAVGAVAAFGGSFSNGRDVVALWAGEWRLTEDAAAVAAAAPEGFSVEDARERGDVGEPSVGTYIVYERDGRAVIRWRNGPFVLEITGHPDAVRDLYLAYPL